MRRREPVLYAPLQISPGYSRSLAFYLVGIHAVTLLALLFTALPMGIRGAFSLLLILSLYRNYHTHVSHLSPHAICSVFWDQAGNWRLRLTSGRILRGQLCADSYLTMSLIVLRFRIANKRRCVLLTADNTPAIILRQLRVRLGLEALGPKKRRAEIKFTRS